jgi:hypothetical protein
VFLSIVTRCCRRPNALTANIGSVQTQDCDDWEQLLLVDHTGVHDEDPIIWANTQFERYRDLPQGDYVYILDDDRWLLYDDVISALRRRASCDADVLLVKAREIQLDNVRYIYPLPDIWEMDWEGGHRPDKWSGVGANVVVKRGVWREHVHYYQHAPGGDWHFINSLIQSGCSFARLFMVVAASGGRGCGVLFEKCRPNWFEGIVERYRPERVKDDVWRIIP